MGKTFQLGRPELAEEVERQLKEGSSARRMERLTALRLAMSGAHTLEQIGKIVGRSRSRIIDWMRVARTEGVEALLGRHQGRGRNPRLRWLLVEAVWRLLRYNPGWRGFKNFGHVLEARNKASGAKKRQAVVACARLLMIDLWRLHVGTATLSALGLQPAAAGRGDRPRPALPEQDFQLSLLIEAPAWPRLTALAGQLD